MAAFNSRADFTESEEFLDFRYKVTRVVAKFEKHGLSEEKYLKAIVRVPDLLCSAPGTIEDNVLNVVKRFKKENLNAADYLKAVYYSLRCFINPQLVSNRIFERLSVILPMTG